MFKVEAVCAGVMPYMNMVEMYLLWVWQGKQQLYNVNMVSDFWTPLYITCMFDNSTRQYGEPAPACVKLSSVWIQRIYIDNVFACKAAAVELVFITSPLRSGKTNLWSLRATYQCGQQQCGSSFFYFFIFMQSYFWYCSYEILIAAVRHGRCPRLFGRLSQYRGPL